MNAATLDSEYGAIKRAGKRAQVYVLMGGNVPRGRWAVWETDKGCYIEAQVQLARYDLKTSKPEWVDDAYRVCDGHYNVPEAETTDSVIRMFWKRFAFSAGYKVSDTFECPHDLDHFISEVFGLSNIKVL